jgi:hypothetical protein
MSATNKALNNKLKIEKLNSSSSQSDFGCSVGKWLGLGLWCLTPLSLAIPRILFSHEYTRGNGWIGRSMMLNATFNNMSVISWRSVLFVEEIGVPGENHNFYHIMLYRVDLVWAVFDLTTLVLLGNNCRNSYKSTNHTITTTTAPVVVGSSCLYIENENLSS